MRDTIARLLAIDWPFWVQVLAALFVLWLAFVAYDALRWTWTWWRHRETRRVLRELRRDRAAVRPQYPTEVPRAARTSIRTVARHSALSRGPSAGPDTAA